MIALLAAALMCSLTGDAPAFDKVKCKPAEETVRENPDTESFNFTVRHIEVVADKGRQKITIYSMTHYYEFESDCRVFVTGEEEQKGIEEVLREFKRQSQFDFRIEVSGPLSHNKFYQIKFRKRLI